MLFAQHAATSLEWACRSCAYVSPLEETLRRRVPLERKAVDDVLGGADAWKNVDQTDATCPACTHTKAYFMQIQIRSADEPSTTFYKCVECGHRWNAD